MFSSLKRCKVIPQRQALNELRQTPVTINYLPLKSSDEEERYEDANRENRRYGVLRREEREREAGERRVEEEDRDRGAEDDPEPSPPPAVSAPDETRNAEPRQVETHQDPHNLDTLKHQAPPIHQTGKLYK